MHSAKNQEFTESMPKFYEHPEYKELKHSWEMFSDLFTGERKKLTNSFYLPYHQLEKAQQQQGSDSIDFAAANRFRSELRAIRVQNTNYTNFVRPILDIWKGLYFRKGAQLSDEAKELLGDAVDDIDGQGSSVEGFIRDSLFHNDYIFGRPIILVDGVNVSPSNKKEEQELGARAYFTCLDPLSVKDWQFRDDKAGELQMLRYEYKGIKPRVTLDAEPEEVLYTRVLELTSAGFRSSIYVSETREKNGTQDKVWSLAEEPKEISGFDSLPVVWKRFNESSLKDYSEEILRHHKLESSLDNGLAYQAWQRIYATGVDVANKEQVAALSAYTMLLFSEEGVNVGTLEPPNPAALMSRVVETRNMIFKKAMRQLQQLPSDSKQVQSAETIQQQENNTVSIIKSRLGDYECLINDALAHYATYFGKSDTDKYTITLDDEITETDTQQTILLFQALQTEFRSLPETKKQFLKALIKDAPLEDKDGALEEIENSEVIQVEGSGELLNALTGA